MEKVQGQSIFQRTAYKTRQNTRARFLTHACVLSRSMCAIPLDHHLTTPSFQPVLYIVFYAPTFFYNHHKQRRKLCTPHNFRRRIIVFSRSSQFSDPEGRWFESSRAHHKKTAVFLHGGLFVLFPLYRICMDLVCDTLCHKPNHIQYDFPGLLFTPFSVPHKSASSSLFGAFFFHGIALSADVVRPELGLLICNDSLAYAELILNSDPQLYLKTVAEYEFLD